MTAVTRRLLPLLAALTATASAGGTEPLSRSQPLHWVPGVRTVSSNRIGAQPFTDAITVAVHGQRLQAFVSSGMHSDDPTTSAINHVIVWVPSAAATPAQKQLLVQVARAYLRGCFLQVTPAQLAALDTLDHWEDGGWHEKTLQGVTIGWSDGNGFAFGAAPGQGGKSRAALSVEWPVNTSRCLF